jgi:ABC-2 type transport system ATP-binding protein
VNSMIAIAVEGLAKRFGEVQAVADVSFEVRQGELFGFLGPNGAGKTTTINILTGLARPDSGTIRIAGIDCTLNPKAAQHLVGIVPDESNLYPELTGFENLGFCAALYGMEKKQREARARELLETFGLDKAADRRFAGYSKGMKRKLTIAAGIIHNPPLLFLDEPTTGIDVASARQIRQLIAGLNRSGTTIFLTPIISKKPRGSVAGSPSSLTGESCGATPWQTSFSRLKKNTWCKLSHRSRNPPSMISSPPCSLISVSRSFPTG